MKIGILAQYLDTRNDVRAFVDTLSAKHAVVLFLNENDKNLHNLVNNNVELRIINSYKRKSIKNHLLIFLYQLFGRLPDSEENYFIVEKFKINNPNNSKLKIWFSLLILYFVKYTPKFISYDNYLNLIAYKKDTPIDDIDAFICFTQIYSDPFYAHLIHSDKNIYAYVYSWDHACKMKCFSQRVKYLVWNEDLMGDLTEIQHISLSNVKILGSTQLAYIFDYKARGVKPVKDTPYLYYVCSTGSPDLIAEETRLMQGLSLFVGSNFPAVIFVIRPYPFIRNWTLYDSLRKLDNVEFDDDFRSSPDDLSVDKNFIYKKFEKIENALAVLHTGTTLGFEGCFFDTPILFLDTISKDASEGLYNFVHQYQNDKYLNLVAFPNVIKNTDQLKDAIVSIQNNPKSYLDYNKAISSKFSLLPLHAIVDKLEQQIASQMPEKMGIDLSLR